MTGPEIFLSETLFRKLYNYLVYQGHNLFQYTKIIFISPRIVQDHILEV